MDACHGGFDEAGIVGSHYRELLRGEVFGREGLHGKSLGKGRTGNGTAEGGGDVLSFGLCVAHMEGYGSAFVATGLTTINEVVVGTRG
ncbi:hypothetical protein [Phocaeicola oris]|uniref:hypothetical protein n=1 Tax=Phocaeicola oris TaxID=2896850 RepID=UPI00234EDBB0|nr:hypothetical protein [Phocaeicola oris]MCE2617321.1 hypothetical protein [Phocaeicola oris]